MLPRPHVWPPHPHPHTPHTHTLTYSHSHTLTHSLTHTYTPPRFRHQVLQLFEASQSHRDWSSAVSNTLSIRVRREQLMQDTLDTLQQVREPCPHSQDQLSLLHSFLQPSLSETHFCFFLFIFTCTFSPHFRDL